MSRKDGLKNYEELDVNDAKKAMSLAAAKLPIKCKFVERNI